ncbi:hypothetical protein [Leptospira sp. GIMC2001]|nr:hypothetical protein [Leptospira sp. GIMC2001]WCL50838.1 hypothetical protein O4O04_08505 [Leptospira sp. GIMC2001]
MYISYEWMEALRLSSLALIFFGVGFLLYYFIKDFLQGEIW